MTDCPARVSAITVTWNSERSIAMCLNSLQKQTGIELEIIVVDNASTDETLVLLERYPQIKINPLPVNRGFCYANNLGISQASGDFILLINPDACLTDGYLSQLVSKLERQPQVAAISGKLLRMLPDGNPLIKDGFSVIDSAGIQLRRTRQAVDIGRGEVDRGQFDKERQVFGVCAAAALYRREALEMASIDDQIFDEKYFAYYEDVDLCWRLGTLGWSFLYTPAAIAYHFRGWREGQRPYQSKFVRYHSYKNKRLTILKNETFKHVIPDLFVLIGFEILAFGYVIINEPFNLKSYLEIIYDLPRIRRYRIEIWQRSKQ